jgi:glycosyltransferase involved in cell wall biosynthesis
MDNIVAIMFAKDEADIISTTITEAMKVVDSIFISDDGSVDGTWDIIKYYKQAYPSKIEYIRQEPDPNDQGQRNSLLNEIRRRYKPENTWVQTIEADIILYTKDLRELISRCNRQNVCMNWHNMNAVRDDWTDIHQFYPHWPEAIQKIMPNFHWLEEFSSYTYRPMPELYFDPVWRPWPRGLSYHLKPEGPRTRRCKLDGNKTPLTLHYGYRGPTHLMTKWNRLKVKPTKPFTKYGFDYTSIDTLMKTFYCFNGVYNRNPAVRANPVDAFHSRG